MCLALWDVLGVVDVLGILEIFSVHIHKVYGQIKSFGWGGGGWGVFDPLQPPYELKNIVIF